MKVVILGGDCRMLFAKAEFKRRGIVVDTLGLTEGDGADPRACDAVLLPVPATRDSVNINCALSGRTVPLDILSNLPENIKVFGGGKLDINNYTDYLALDEYALKNAVLTAEGAIAYAIEHTGFSLFESRVLVIGYGKVGKLLTDRIRAFCPDLTVSARSKNDLCMLQLLGIKRIVTSEIKNLKENYHIVFNTVDINFDEHAAALTGAHFFDLSSRGGFSPGEAERNSIEYVKLPSVPAKTAPYTAGRIIAETVIELLE